VSTPNADAAEAMTTHNDRLEQSWPATEVQYFGLDPYQAVVTGRYRARQ
jgi:hypothetical protein